MTNFYCLKWGKKYSSEYVNKLFKKLKKYYQDPFTFHCLTDDSDGIDKDVSIKPIPTTFSHFPRTQIFTSEKMCYFDDQMSKVSGAKAWFDLDILIQNDITDLINSQKTKPVFIWNYWRDDQSVVNNFHNMTTPINSSFVAWQDDIGHDMYTRLYDKQDVAFFMYPSFDKYLFYQEHRRKSLEYWNKGTVYNYNIGASYPDDLNPQEFKSSYKICLFNTSHKKWAGNNETQVELHEAQGWAKEMWDA